jgi:hypothetical protein
VAGGLVIVVVILLIVLLRGHATPNDPVAALPRDPTLDATIAKADRTALTQVSHYDTATRSCHSATHPAACEEKADRTLGDQIHAYANLVGSEDAPGIAATDVNGARNAAQSSANRLENIGDAAQTSAAYTKTARAIHLSNSLAALEAAIGQLDRDVSG